MKCLSRNAKRSDDHPPVGPGIATLSKPHGRGKTIEGPKTAIRSLEKAFALLRSVHRLEGTDKDGVEHLLAIALEQLRVNQ
jgi:hypothetical protein